MSSLLEELEALRAGRRGRVPGHAMPAARGGDGEDEEDDKWWVWKLLEALWDVLTRFPEFVSRSPFPIPRITWPVLIPIGFDLPGEGEITRYVITKGFKKGAVRAIGRAVGDIAVPISIPIGLAIALAPSQIENAQDGAPWNEFVGDLMVDNVGFWTGEVAGKVALFLVPDELVDGAFGVLVVPVAADVGAGFLYDTIVDATGIREGVVDWVGGLGQGDVQSAVEPAPIVTPTPPPSLGRPYQAPPVPDPVPTPDLASSSPAPTPTPSPGGE